jgi:hypothetical protein
MDIIQNNGIPKHMKFIILVHVYIVLHSAIYEGMYVWYIRQTLCKRQHYANSAVEYTTIETQFNIVLHLANWQCKTLLLVIKPVLYHSLYVGGKSVFRRTDISMKINIHSCLYRQNVCNVLMAQ